MIKEMTGPVYRFKESRSRLHLRKKAFEQADKGDDSADIAEISTAPTQRTSPVYVPLEDSFEEAGLRELHHQPTKENSVPHIRTGKSMSESDDDRGKSIFNSCPEDIKVAEVKLFLEKLGMSKFESVFLKNGFDTMDVLMEITEEMMKQLEIPIGFRIKFNKIRADMQLKSLQKLPNKNLSVSEKVLTSTERSQPIEKEISNPPKVSCQTEGIQTDTGDLAFSARNSMIGFGLNTTKYCYRCFSKVREVHESEYCPGNHFCSEMCLKFFFLEHTIICASESCKAMGVKTRSYFHNGLWFCSETCLSNNSLAFNDHSNNEEINKLQCKDQEKLVQHDEGHLEEHNLLENQKTPYKSEIGDQTWTEDDTDNDPNQEKEALPHEVDLDFDF